MIPWWVGLLLFLGGFYAGLFLFGLLTAATRRRQVHVIDLTGRKPRERDNKQHQQDAQ